MTTSRTRLDEATSEFERDLLGSWDAEAPPRELRGRVLGVVASAGTLGAASGSAAAASGAALGAAAPKIVNAGILGIAKWVTVGAVIAVGGALSGMEALSRHAAPALSPTVAIVPTLAAKVAAMNPRPVLGASPPSDPERVASPPQQEVVVEAPVTSSPSGDFAASSTAVPERARPATVANKADRPSLPSVVNVAALPAPSASAPAATRASFSLGNEVESVDRARAALAAGDPAQARRLVDEYHARFGSGILSQEATVIRIEALAKSGDAAGASALAAPFLRAHPTSPHAARIRRLVGGAASNP